MDLPAANYCSIRSLFIERRIGRPKAKCSDNYCEHRPQNAAQSVAFGREIPAEQHQYAEADKKVSTGVMEFSIFDFRFSISSSASLPQPGLITPDTFYFTLLSGRW